MIDTGLDEGHPYSGAPYSLVRKVNGVAGDLPLVTYTYGFTIEKERIDSKGRTKKNKNRYLVHIEEYEHKMLILKFHHKADLKSDKKYNVVLDKGEACRVIATCAKIALADFAMKDPSYSFGFIGAEREKKADPIRGRPAEMESRHNTKRFQVWSRIAKRFFNPNNWMHAPSVSNSAYAIFRKNVYSTDLEVTITEMFKRHYLDLFDSSASEPDTASVG